MIDVRETHNRLGKAATYGRRDDDDDGEGIAGTGRRRYRTEQQLAERTDQRKRFQFEATASDDELEDELDDNLDEIGNATKTLKALSMAMGQELGVQNDRIGRIEEKTVNLDGKLFRNTEKVCSSSFGFCRSIDSYYFTFLCSSRGSSDTTGVSSYPVPCPDATIYCVHPPIFIDPVESQLIMSSNA